MTMTMHTISPLDGRYADKIGHLGTYFSEIALMAQRTRVECTYLLAQEETGLWPKLSASERDAIQRRVDGLDADAYAQIKVIEAETRHDVKAVEIFLQRDLGLADPNRIHFGLTSEDVNNLAYSTMFDAYRRREQLPLLKTLLALLRDRVVTWRDAPIPTRTHGQKASPSTAGKELAVPLERLCRVAERLETFRFRGKLNGATGTASAFAAAAPEVDWLAFGDAFVERLGFQPNLATTQIDDHDAWADYLDLTRRLANILIDLDRDLWLTLSMGFFVAKTEAAAVGSSTMPHKVNPIRFEKSEGNLELAVGLLGTIADKLTRSRLQRDLSDSTVSRNIGVALAHVHLALQETIGGLEELTLNEARCSEELDASPELLAEPIQTILRLAGVDDPYGRLKAATRGKAVTRDALMALVDGLDVPDTVKARCHALSVRATVGLAPSICDRVVAHADRVLATQEASR